MAPRGPFAGPGRSDGRLVRSAHARDWRPGSLLGASAARRRPEGGEVAVRTTLSRSPGARVPVSRDRAQAVRETLLSATMGVRLR